MSSRREEIIENQYNEIKLLESRYRRLYEDSPVMLRTINRDGIILDCNHAYVKGLGYSAKEEVIGHSIFEHTPDQGIALKRESFELWRKTGNVMNREVWLKRKDGSKFPAVINANNLYDESGIFVGSNTVIIDLTEIYKAREQLEKANKQVKKAYEMREEFIKIAAHELRTPIQPILLIAEDARSRFPNQEHEWAMVLRETIRLKQLADEIVDVSLIESGDFTYDMQDIRINDVITKVSDAARPQVKKGRSSSVVIENQLDKDVKIRADPMRLTQALSNIVDNAINFTKEGRVSIETTVLADKKLFEIKIADDGPGISDEMLNKLFGKFEAKSPSSRHGTGLGLFITKAIIQAHGGDVIGYNNENGRRGATFIVRLPFKQVCS